ncbi:hypothetical protein PsorP6_015469 [Peronosclerospora sorghi]|uniref:Uncharacterized protein n=1 Tax=Peronosclerospora sorghi TaxID=230839 RepID=A0ACC0WNP8_9STRA|nr:hypothetical protein PsorP6_015469 [Peronosclerospora sorghi]
MIYQLVARLMLDEQLRSILYVISESLSNCKSSSRVVVQSQGWSQRDETQSQECIGIGGQYFCKVGVNVMKHKAKNALELEFQYNSGSIHT